MLTYFPVPAEADGLCGVAYALHGGADGASMRLPALMPQVQVCLAGAIAMSQGGGPMIAAPPVSLVGATHGAAEARLSPGARVVGVGLMSRGWRGAVGENAYAMADVRVDGGAVWGDGATARLFAAMSAGVDDAAAVEALFAFVADRAWAAEARRVADIGSDWRLAEVDAWLAETGGATVDGLVARLGLSRRQVERLTTRHYGAAPKLLELKYKTLRLAAATALRQVGSPVSEPADGFYDQSHRIKNFRRFVGWTPAQFQREHADFSRAMLLGRWRAGARSAMALWS